MGRVGRMSMGSVGLVVQAVEVESSGRVHGGGGVVRVAVEVVSCQRRTRTAPVMTTA